MQLHSSKIISSFYYILRWIGQTSKTFRTWICMNSGQLEDFSKIQINLLVKLVLLPSAFLKSFTFYLFLNIFPFSLLLCIFILNHWQDLRFSLGYFREDQPGGGEAYPDDMPASISTELAFSIKHGGLWWHFLEHQKLGNMYAKWFDSNPPTRGETHQSKDADAATHAMRYNLFPQLGNHP